MEEDYTVSETHNLVANKYVNSHQVKYLALCRLDSFKAIYENNTEIKFLCNAILAGTNFIKLFCLFQNSRYEEIGFWKIYDQITGIHCWDKLIVVQTPHKVVGFTYEDSMLKNAFMLSLQFLPLHPFDSCRCVSDRGGYSMAIIVKDYLLICCSDFLIQKYRSKPFYKQGTQVISEDIKWNRGERKYVEEVIKIKCSDLEFTHIHQIKLCDEFLYLVAQKDTEKGLYYIHLQSFFNERSKQPICQLIAAITTEFREIHPIHTQQSVDYLIIKKDSIYMQVQKEFILVDEFESPFEIVSKPTPSMFPLCVRSQSNPYTYLIYNRTGTQQITKSSFQINHDIEAFDFKESLLLYTTKCETMVEVNQQINSNTNINTNVNTNLNNLNSKTVISRTFGNLIDFTLSKNMLIAQNYEGSQSRVCQLNRSLKTDPKPYVTHVKKTFLESLAETAALKSMKSAPNIIQTKTDGKNTVYREREKDFEVLAQGILWLRETLLNEQNVLVAFVDDKTIHVLETNQWKLMDSFQSEIPLSKTERIWLIETVLVFQSGSEFTFLNLVDKSKFMLPIAIKQSIVNIFVIKKEITLRKKEKDQYFFEILLCYAKLLEIYQVNATLQRMKLQLVSPNIGEGPAILFHSLDTNPNNRLRSITCPQYVLSDYSINTPVLNILSCHLFRSKGCTFLVMVNSKQELLVFKRHICFSNQIGSIYKRVILPLHIIKGFKYASGGSFQDKGLDVFEISNYVLFQAQFLENTPNSKTYFEMDGGTWVFQNDSKIRRFNYKGILIENFVSTKVDCHVTNEIIGIEHTNEFFCVYSRNKFQILGKDLNSLWNVTLNHKNENIICIKAFEHYIAMSYYDVYENDTEFQAFQSIKFRLRVYNVLTKNKIIEKEKATEQPILHIRYIAPDKLMLVTSSSIFVNVIKNQKSLELLRTRNFSRRGLLGCFSYMPQIVPQKPGYMLFGGQYGGLSFFIGKWIESDILREQWFEGFNCGIRFVEFFHYGEELKALVADNDCNLIVLNLKANCAQKLADFNTGSLANNLKVRGDSENIVYGCFADGTIRIVTAVKLRNVEVSYLDFQQCLCKYIPLLGGFNLRQSSNLKQHLRSYNVTSKGNMIDYDILEDFFSLTHSLKIHILEESELTLDEVKNLLIV